MSDLSIEFVDASDQPALFDLYRRVASFPPPDQIARYHAWKFEANPQRDGRRLHWAARLDGRLVGSMAHMPVTVSAAGQKAPAAWAVDLMVAPEARGRGVARRIFEHFRRHVPVALSMGYGPASATSRVARASGFVGLQPRRYLFRLLSMRPLAQAVPGGAMVGTLLGPASRTLLRYRRRPALAGEVTRLSRFDDLFDTLWARVSRETAVCVHRDRATMNWRYFENPFHTYTVLALLDGATLRGCLVAKVVQQSPYVYGTIAEFLVPEQEDDVQHALLAEAMQLFEDARVDIVKTLEPPGKIGGVLRRAGFRSFGRRSDLVVATDSSLGHDLRTAVGDASAWYLTKGDCDLDMVPDFQTHGRSEASDA